MIKIPSRQDYEIFLEKFTEGISKKLPSACFFTYGSIDNHHFVPGISDIDGGIILDSGVVTDKEKILDLVELFSASLGNAGIRIQLNLLDRKTCQSGRFLSYAQDYTDWIKQSGNIRSKLDYTKEMNGLNFRSDVLHTASFNFCGPNGVRNSLLYSLVYANESHEEFVKNTSKALDKFAKFPKKLVWLRGGNVTVDKNEAKKELEGLLQDVDFTALERVNSLLKNPDDFYAIFGDYDHSVGLLVESLDCLEHMIESYLRHFPKSGKRELNLSLFSRIKNFFS
jgi:hypothetical protein